MENEREQAYKSVKEPYNKAKLSGIVTHVYFKENPKQCQVTILTPYIRTVVSKATPKYDSTSNYTTVIFFDDAVDDVKNMDIKPMDNVTIVGSMRSYKDKGLGKHFQNVRGEGIIKTPPVMEREMGEKHGKNPGDPYSRIYLRGEIKSVIYKDNWKDFLGKPKAVSILINVGGKIENKIAVDYYLDPAHPLKHKLTAGMWVSVYGAMQSRVSKLKDKTVVYNNMVAKEIIVHDFDHEVKEPSA